MGEPDRATRGDVSRLDVLHSKLVKFLTRIVTRCIEVSGYRQEVKTFEVKTFEVKTFEVKTFGVKTFDLLIDGLD